MNEEKQLRIIWIVFGFIFITAVDSILYLLVHLIYFAMSELGLSHMALIVLIPLLTLLLYVLTAYLIYKRSTSRTNNQIKKQLDSPKKSTLILLLATSILLPIATNYLDGLYATNLDWNNIEARDYLASYGWKSLGIQASRWIVIGSIIIVFITSGRLKIAEIQLVTNIVI